MSKARGQRSIYVEEEKWEAAKDLAWEQRLSVSKLILDLLEKEGERWAKEGKPPSKKRATKQ